MVGYQHQASGITLPEFLDESLVRYDLPATFGSDHDSEVTVTECLVLLGYRISLLQHLPTSEETLHEPLPVVLHLGLVIVHMRVASVTILFPQGCGHIHGTPQYAMVIVQRYDVAPRIRNGIGCECQRFREREDEPHPNRVQHIDVVFRTESLVHHNLKPLKAHDIHQSDEPLER